MLETYSTNKCIRPIEHYSYYWQVAICNMSFFVCDLQTLEAGTSLRIETELPCRRNLLYNYCSKLLYALLSEIGTARRMQEYMISFQSAVGNVMKLLSL